MASPPHPDPLSQRRKQDINDDFYDNPICPCEEVEPEPMSEYEVPGEWVTYTGEVNMAIFENAAKNAKAELEKELIAYAKLEQAGTSADAQPSASHSSSEPSTVAQDEFAPSAPMLDEKEQVEEVEVPPREVEVERAVEVAPQDSHDSEQEAYDQMADECEELQHVYEEQERLIAIARRRRKEIQDTYKQILIAQEVHDLYEMDVEARRVELEEARRVELEEARRKDMEAKQKEQEEQVEDLVVVVIPVEDIQPKDDITSVDFEMAELGSDDLVTVCQIIEMDEDPATAGNSNDVADANSPNEAETEDAKPLSAEMAMEGDKKDSNSADSPCGELVIDETNANSLNAEFRDEPVVLQSEDALSAGNVHGCDCPEAQVQDAPAGGAVPLASAENQAIVVANAPEQVAENE